MIRDIRPSRLSGDESLDDVIKEIERDLPKIHRLCRVESKQKRTGPALLLQSAQIKDAFQAFAEDSLLTQSGDDIKLAESDDDTETLRPNKINGRD